MKSIKTSISTRLAALLFGAALFGLASQSALAVGTYSGRHHHQQHGHAVIYRGCRCTNRRYPPAPVTVFG